MKITILGAGVVGITTAYFLAKAGHDVLVIDRQKGAGEECSFSNAAQLSYTAAQPWANFDALKKGILWMGRKDAPLRFRLRADIHMWTWLFRFMMNCNKKAEKKNTQSILDICMYSRDVFYKNKNDFDFDFDLSSKGKIYVFESEADFRASQRQCQLQETMGATYHILTFDEILEFEPGLKHMRGTIIGGIRESVDDTADAYKFCIGLEKKLRNMGVKFHFSTSITEIQKDKKKITKVITDKGEFTADMFVMSLGSYSTQLLRKIGIRIPVHPLKGYSITIDIKNSASAPVSSITFDDERTVFSRLGNRMRVSGTAEFAGYDTSITPERIEMLKKLTRKAFPDCGDLENAQEWACLRPSTPDGSPIIGHSKYDNLVINTGQGSLGWTMAFASAKLTADVIDGNKPGIDIAPYSIKRF